MYFEEFDHCTQKSYWTIGLAKGSLVIAIVGPLVGPLVSRLQISRIPLFVFFKFWTPGLPEGVLSNRPCPCVCVRVCVRPSLNISETAHWFFLIFCMKLEHHKGTKVTETDF